MPYVYNMPCSQRIMQLRRLFLARLRDVQARRGAITAALTAAVPSDVQHRQSTVAQLEVGHHTRSLLGIVSLVPWWQAGKQAGSTHALHVCRHLVIPHA